MYVFLLHKGLWVVNNSKHQHTGFIVTVYFNITRHFTVKWNRNEGKNNELIETAKPNNNLENLPVLPRDVDNSTQREDVMID